MDLGTKQYRTIVYRNPKKISIKLKNNAIVNAQMLRVAERDRKRERPTGRARESERNVLIYICFMFHDSYKCSVCMRMCKEWKECARECFCVRFLVRLLLIHVFFSLSICFVCSVSVCVLFVSFLRHGSLVFFFVHFVVVFVFIVDLCLCGLRCCLLCALFLFPLSKYDY